MIPNNAAPKKNKKKKRKKTKKKKKKKKKKPKKKKTTIQPPPSEQTKSNSNSQRSGTAYRAGCAGAIAAKGVVGAGVTRVGGEHAGPVAVAKRPPLRAVAGTRPVGSARHALAAAAAAVAVGAPPAPAEGACLAVGVDVAGVLVAVVLEAGAVGAVGLADARLGADAPLAGRRLKVRHAGGARGVVPRAVGAAVVVVPQRRVLGAGGIKARPGGASCHTGLRGTAKPALVLLGARLAVLERGAVYTRRVEAGAPACKGACLPGGGWRVGVSE